MFYFYCKLYNIRATAVLSSTTFCPVFTDFSASFLTTPWKMPKKQPKNFFIKKLFFVLLMIRSKLSLSKKLANSMILANDLCQPSVWPHSSKGGQIQCLKNLKRKSWSVLLFYCLTLKIKT